MGIVNWVLKHVQPPSGTDPDMIRPLLNLYWEDWHNDEPEAETDNEFLHWLVSEKGWVLQPGAGSSPETQPPR